MNKSSYKTYDDLPLMLSVPDVAKVLGISRAGAYELAHSKEFPSMKIGSRIIVPIVSTANWQSASPRRRTQSGHWQSRSKR